MFLMLSLNWLFISSGIELIAELVVWSRDTMIAEYDVNRNTESSSRNRNTILEEGFSGIPETPKTNIIGNQAKRTMFIRATDIYECIKMYASFLMIIYKQYYNMLPPAEKVF